jgi:general secretion pathway protein H
MPRRSSAVSTRASLRGLSLIELLVVLVILGVIASALALSIGGGAARQVEGQAQRIEALITLACEQSELTGRDLGMFFSRKRIEFAWRGVDRWLPLPDAAREPLRPRGFDDGIEVELEREGEILPLADEMPADPQLACLASGELSPFELRLARADVPQRWQLHGALDGRLELEAIDGR